MIKSKKMNGIDQRLISQILRNHVKPSVGCTEPVAVALATSIAYHAIIGKVPKFIEIIKNVNSIRISPKNIEEITIDIDRNTYKNSLAVGIPGTPNLQGIYIAAALGVFCDPDRELTLFSDSNGSKMSLAKNLLEKNKVKINLMDNCGGQSDINIRAKIRVEGNEGEAWIQHDHSNITFIRRNNEVLFDKRDTSKNHKVSGDIKYIADMNISQLIYIVENLSEEDKAFINEGIEMNKKASEIGIRKKLGLKIGYTIQKLNEEKKLKDNEINLAKSKTAGAGDARMSGYSLPVMSSCGSGNQGIVAILPILAVAEKRGVDKKKLIRAVALSHLVTSYITYYSGYLSALCGCAIKAGIGATVGITYYLGGDIEKIGMAINNIAGNITGMICDGAKVGCAMKMATAAGVAVESGLLALEGIGIPLNNGIVAKNPEDTLKNIGRISEGMISTDKSIVEIMTDK